MPPCVELLILIYCILILQVQLFSFYYQKQYIFKEMKKGHIFLPNG